MSTPLAPDERWTVVDPFILKEHLRAFAAFVEEQTGEPLRSLRSHPYLVEHESYKAILSAVGRRRLNVRSWTEADVGTGRIARNVTSAVEIKKAADVPRNNLVPWEGRWGDGSRPHQALTVLGTRSEAAKVERPLFDFYRGRTSDEDAFRALVSVFGKQYALLGYLYFLKDPRAFAPVSTGAFDAVFARLGVDHKMGGRASWENYAAYNRVLAEVAGIVSDLLGDDTSALDAHSFLWTLERSVYAKGRTPSPQEAEAVSRLQLYLLDTAPKDRQAVVAARVGQGAFRKRLVARWGTCAVTGCAHSALLRASHIKPWADCDAHEARDPANGILLVAGLDAAFDAGLITFDSDGALVPSAALLLEDARGAGIPLGGRLRGMDPQSERYLEYHRRYVFSGGA